MALHKTLTDFHAKQMQMIVEKESISLLGGYQIKKIVALESFRYGVLARGGHQLFMYMRDLEKFAGATFDAQRRDFEIAGTRLRLPTSDELIAIHKEFAGTPPGWSSGSLYWTATPSTSGHAYVHLLNGRVHGNTGSHPYVDHPRYVALQLL